MVSVVSKSSDCALLEEVWGCGSSKVNYSLVCFSEGGQEIFQHFVVTRRDSGCNLEYEAKSKAEAIAR
jgi:hypothetical protein